MLAAALCLGLAGTAWSQDPAAPETPRTDYSQAEKLVFMGDPMSRLKPPLELRYRFHKEGALESGFDDDVKLQLSAESDGTCCQVQGDFMSGTNRLSLPLIEHADANPVLLFFLERDVRDMKRLAKGNENYYRKRIRMAIFEGATVTPVSLRWQGREVKGQQVSIAPYDNDPARSRFEKFARKRYDFFLADDVPGGVYGARVVMRDARDDAPPMLVEELFLDGADPTTGRIGR